MENVVLQIGTAAGAVGFFLAALAYYETRQNRQQLDQLAAEIAILLQTATGHSTLIRNLIEDVYTDIDLLPSAADPAQEPARRRVAVGALALERIEALDVRTTAQAAQIKTLQTAPKPLDSNSVETFRKVIEHVGNVTAQSNMRAKTWYAAALRNFERLAKRIDVLARQAAPDVPALHKVTLEDFPEDTTSRIAGKPSTRPAAPATKETPPNE